MAGRGGCGEPVGWSTVSGAVVSGQMPRPKIPRTLRLHANVRPAITSPVVMRHSMRRVVAGVIERDGRVLVALRPPEKRHGGMWEFPGGKVEGGESDLAALGRELAEELALRVTSVSAPLAEFHDPGSEFLIAFVLAVAEGEPECREHVAVRWATWAELRAMPLAPTDRNFVVGRDSG